MFGIAQSLNVHSILDFFTGKPREIDSRNDLQKLADSWGFTESTLADDIYNDASKLKRFFVDGKKSLETEHRAIKRIESEIMSETRELMLSLARLRALASNKPGGGAFDVMFSDMSKRFVELSCALLEETAELDNIESAIAEITHTLKTVGNIK